MASAIDLGEKYDIHPRNKMPLGDRLLVWARKLAYGEDVVASGPYPKSFEVKDKSFVITYSYAESGLTAKDGKLDGFEIAGADGQYVPAQARIEGQNVIAWSDQAREPAHLRYAWEGFPPCSLYNKEGLPALPFSYSVPGKSFFPDTAQFEFLNPGFKSQKDGKPEGWGVTGTGNVAVIPKGGGGFCVRLEPEARIVQEDLAVGAGYFWNCLPDTPHFLRPGCLVGYSVDMAVENEGEATAYLNMASDSTAGGSGTTWNPVYVLKVVNKEFSRYSLTHLIGDQDLFQIVNWKNSVGGRWINQSKTSALLLADFSNVQIVRPLLEISPAIPIQVGAGKASPLIVIRNAQPKTLQKRLAPDQPVEGSSTVLYGCASFAPDERGLMEKLIEPTDHVGGVNTGGLCFSDSNQTVRSTVMGFFDEWHTRIEADYTSRGVKLPYKVSEKDQKHWTYEPSAAMRITRQMLDEAKVQVLTKRVLQSVTKDGARITRLRTSDGDFSAKVFIDGSYEGDLMAAAGVSWTIGREGRKEFGESLAGKRYPKPLMRISGRDDAGKILPLITTDDAGPEDAGDKNVMVYSFRLCLTKDPANRVPFPAPRHYDPARFEVIRRYFAKGKTVAMWDLYPLPGGKFD
ncbi:MAG: FAD-dependent oxidoreductase, partial [Verrucomicrobiota bacterium]